MQFFSFDAFGIPTADAKGQPISKTLRGEAREDARGVKLIIEMEQKPKEKDCENDKKARNVCKETKHSTSFSSRLHPFFLSVFSSAATRSQSCDKLQVIMHAYWDSIDRLLFSMKKRKKSCKLLCWW